MYNKISVIHFEKLIQIIELFLAKRSYKVMINILHFETEQINYVYNNYDKFVYACIFIYKSCRKCSLLFCTIKCTKGKIQVLIKNLFIVISFSSSNTMIMDITLQTLVIILFSFLFDETCHFVSRKLFATTRRCSQTYLDILFGLY